MTYFSRFTSAQMVASVLALVFLSVPASAQEATEAYRLAPGVLVSTDLDAGFAMQPGGGTVAFGLRDGKRRWQSEAIDKPLALVRFNLIGLKETDAEDRLDLVALGARTGRTANETSVSLPLNARAAIDRTAETYFAIDTEGPRTQSRTLYWRYYALDKPEPWDGRDAPRVVAESFGGLIVDENAQVVRRVPGFSHASGRAPSFGAELGRPTPALPAVGQQIYDLDQKVTIGPSSTFPGAATGPLPGGTRDFPDAVGVPAVPQDEGLLLPGPLGQDLLLFVRGEQFADSLDRRHIMVSAFDKRADRDAQYRIQIVHKATRQIISSYTARTSLAPFIVAGDTIVYVRQPATTFVRGDSIDEPLSVVGRSLASGNVIWTQKIRDTSVDERELLLTERREVR
ncbi:MAG: hypothetical protein AAGH41_05625 [Pseudomonadota bacterium]